MKTFALIWLVVLVSLVSVFGQRQIPSTVWSRDFLRSQTEAEGRAALGLLSTDVSTLQVIEDGITPDTTIADTDEVRFFDGTDPSSITYANFLGNTWAHTTATNFIQNVFQTANKSGFPNPFGWHMTNKFRVFNVKD